MGTPGIMLDGSVFEGVFSPNSVVTLGVLTVMVKGPGWLDRGGGRVVHRFHRYFRGFVLACSFRL